MDIEEEEIRTRIKFYVREKYITQELWSFLEKYEDELEKASKTTKDDENYKMSFSGNHHIV